MAVAAHELSVEPKESRDIQTTSTGGAVGTSRTRQGSREWAEPRPLGRAHQLSEAEMEVSGSEDADAEEAGPQLQHSGSLSNVLGNETLACL